MAREWHKRITKRITDRFNEWRAKRLPATLYGRSLAIKNSVLAVAWYLVNHALPPDGDLDSLMSKWQEEAFRFLDDSARSAALGTRGSTVVARSRLAQDHSDHGARVTDVESFTRSLLCGWAKQLVSLNLT